MSSNFIMKKLIYNYMNPTLIPFRNFRDEFIIKAFNDHIQTQVKSLLNLYFLLRENLQHLKNYSQDYPSKEEEPKEDDSAQILESQASDPKSKKADPKADAKSAKSAKGKASKEEAKVEEVS